ncbi:MAG TPA: HNH endonuclease signature motif containing protein [Tepidisphaeraceae bacterium]|nr:HNH endonuclease signature motif containing protein [Tepidisphaeraceae bacterium]
MPTRPPQHRPAFQPSRTVDQLRGSAAVRGYDATWRKFRLAFLQRHPVCCFAEDQRHRGECTLAATIVDHITPLNEGGARLDERNCRSVCRRAHEILTNNYTKTGANELPARSN